MSWFPIIVLVAQLSAAPAPVQRAYQKQTSAEREAKKTTVKQPKSAHRIDVSTRIRSASFGHKTWLWVSSDGKQFWVEYSRSTNTPAGLFGPFTADQAGAPTTPPPKPIESPPPPQDPKLRKRHATFAQKLKRRSHVCGRVTGCCDVYRSGPRVP